jgi:nucleotide-binding universal stress UspA family protein
MSLQKIVSYVDLGNSSRKGVRLTAAIAENHGASVEIVLTGAKMPLYSTSIGGEPAFVPPGLVMKVLAATQEAIDMRLAEAVGVLESETLDGRVTTHRLQDHQVDALIEHARASEADLIVMSCESMGLFDRIFHRSFAEKLARSSSCPVIVIAGDIDVSPKLRKILVATDYSECSRHAAFAARNIVGEEGVMTFHHVIPWSVLERSGVSLETEEAKLEKWVRELHFMDVETGSCVSAGSPDSEIARVADETEADIVVVGSRPHEDWSEKLFGTVTDRLIEICKRPVLAVPRLAVVAQPM